MQRKDDRDRHQRRRSRAEPTRTHKAKLGAADLDAWREDARHLFGPELALANEIHRRVDSRIQWLVVARDNLEQAPVRATRLLFGRVLKLLRSPIADDQDHIIADKIAHVQEQRDAVGALVRFLERCADELKRHKKTSEPKRLRLAQRIVERTLSAERNSFVRRIVSSDDAWQDFARAVASRNVKAAAGSGRGVKVALWVEHLYDVAQLVLIIPPGTALGAFDRQLRRIQKKAPGD